MKTVMSLPTKILAGGSMAFQSHLVLVNQFELEQMRFAIARGALPVDFEHKLRRIAAESLTGRFIEQQCRWFAALLIAVQSGQFRGVDNDRFQQLMRVLAYVRKEDDAIPDYQVQGLVDDRHEVRLVVVEMQLLIAGFKDWWLRSRVPVAWNQPVAFAI